MPNIFKNDDGTYSKTKIGATIVGLGLVAVTLGNAFQGRLANDVLMEQLATEIGGLLVVFGIRDLPILNLLSKK